MCILMYFGPGAMPIRSHLENGCENNPDGFGYAVVVYRENRIITGHSMDAERAIAEFIRVREAYPDDSAVFHARITTDGSSTLDNCHPFKVSGRDDMVLAHNGILPCRPEKGDDRSDTRILAEDLFERTWGRMDRAKTRRRFEAWLGTGSKVIVLTTDRRFKFQSYIFNERLGHWLDEKVSGGKDIWYSNHSHECRYRSYGSYAIGGVTVSRSGSRATYTESWDDEYGSRYSGYAYACVECGYKALYCGCSEPVMRFVPSWQARSPEDAKFDEDDPGTWKCEGCDVVGEISPITARCNVCHTMFCCDKAEAECTCWDDDGKIIVPTTEPTAGMSPATIAALGTAVRALTAKSEAVAQTLSPTFFPALPAGTVHDSPDDV